MDGQYRELPVTSFRTQLEFEVSQTYGFKYNDYRRTPTKLHSNQIPGKEYAYIYDFIVIPTLNPADISLLSAEEKEIERKIIAREYERVKEFAQLAENSLEITAEFLGKWKMYLGGNEHA